MVKIEGIKYFYEAQFASSDTAQHQLKVHAMVSVSFHPSVHLVLPKLDGAEADRLQSFQHVFLEGCKCIITIVMKILFHNSPEILFAGDFAQLPSA